MPYIDGFLIVVPTKQVAAYKRLASKAQKIWAEHGAVQYVETVGDDLKVKGMGSFEKAAGAKRGESVVFSWVMWTSKSARNAANKKIMKDPRVAKMMEKSEVKMDMQRMCFGGFKVLVNK